MRSVYASIILILTLVIWSAANIMWSGNHHVGIIKADGKGYYAHLPAVFIYDDLNFGFYDSLEGEGGKYYNSNYAYEFRKDIGGKAFNKYYCGTALPMMPFFLGAHAYALTTDFAADGYSKPYNISIAAIFYMLASLWLIVLILKRFHVKENIIAFVLPIIVFGTNWYYYVLNEPAVSHVYSIFFITWFIYLGLQWAKSSRPKLIGMAILFGLIVLIRPVNAVVLLLTPFFFINFSTFRKALANVFRNYKKLIAALFFGLAVVSIQLIVYKIQTGHFYVYSYEDEGFNFMKPEIYNILFSYKKGLFLYTPILLICLFGCVPLFKKSKWQAVSIFGFLGLLTYVLSSWWNWYYGGSFSSRVYLDYLVLFALPLAVLLSHFKTLWKRNALLSGLFVLVLFCQFQTYQYRRNIIHWDQMDKAKYWEVFLDFDGLK